VGSGKVCRMHGIRKPNMVRRGANDPQYRYVWETLYAKAERSGRLRVLEALSFGPETVSEAKRL
jgi:hypothetical protein